MIFPADIENVRRINHLSQSQIARELGISEHSVAWIRRRYIGRVPINRPSVSKIGPPLECTTKRYLESDKAAAHWAGITFEDARVKPMGRSAAVKVATWVPAGSSIA